MERPIPPGREGGQRLPGPGAQGFTNQIAMPGQSFSQKTRVEAKAKAAVGQIEPGISLERLGDRPQ